jgi:hypothetical protein
MLIFDDEFNKFRHCQDQYLYERATKIKDYLREDGIIEIVALLFEIIKGYKFLDLKQVKNSLKVIARLIDWNQLFLFTDIVNFTKENFLISVPLLSENLEVFNSIIHKGMDYQQKIEVIKYLNINEILISILRPSENIKIKIDETIFFKICEIVTNLGDFVKDSYFSLKKSCTDKNLFTNEQNDLFQNTNSIANCTIFISNYILDLSKKFDHNTIFQISDFLNELITYLKSDEYVTNILVRKLRLIY